MDSFDTPSLLSDHHFSDDASASQVTLRPKPGAVQFILDYSRALETAPCGSAAHFWIKN